MNSDTQATKPDTMAGHAPVDRTGAAMRDESRHQLPATPGPPASALPGLPAASTASVNAFGRPNSAETSCRGTGSIRRAPRHEEIRFAFKPFCFLEAKARGYELALFVDAGVSIKAPLDPLFDVIARQGTTSCRITTRWEGSAATTPSCRWESRARSPSTSRRPGASWSGSTSATNAVIASSSSGVRWPPMASPSPAPSGVVRADSPVLRQPILGSAGTAARGRRACWPCGSASISGPPRLRSLSFWKRTAATFAASMSADRQLFRLPETDTPGTLPPPGIPRECVAPWTAMPPRNRRSTTTDTAPGFTGVARFARRGDEAHASLRAGGDRRRRPPRPRPQPGRGTRRSPGARRHQCRRVEHRPVSQSRAPDPRRRRHPLDRPGRPGRVEPAEKRRARPDRRQPRVQGRDAGRAGRRPDDATVTASLGEADRVSRPGSNRSWPTPPTTSSASAPCCSKATRASTRQATPQASRRGGEQDLRVADGSATRQEVDS